jgi:hypothetical protein
MWLRAGDGGPPPSTEASEEKEADDRFAAHKSVYL